MTFVIISTDAAGEGLLTADTGPGGEQPSLQRRPPGGHCACSCRLGDVSPAQHKTSLTPGHSECVFGINTQSLKLKSSPRLPYVAESFDALIVLFVEFTRFPSRGPAQSLAPQAPGRTGGGGSPSLGGCPGPAPRPPISLSGLLQRQHLGKCVLVPLERARDM